MVTMMHMTLSTLLALSQEPSLEELGGLSNLVRWTGVLSSVVVVVGAFFVLRFLNDSVGRLNTRFAAHRLLFQKIATFAQFAIYISTAVVVMAMSLRLDDTALALIGGTIAVSIGFSIKDLVASFIAGVTIMADRPFQVGDRVMFGGEYGDITAIGLRSVQMQTLDDNTVTIPNNKFLNEITSCGNYGQLDMQVVMDFHIGADQDMLRARTIASEAALSSRYVFLAKPVAVFVTQVVIGEMVAIRLRVKAYVLDTKFEKAFETDVHVRVLQAFAASAIAPPTVLHRVIYEGEGARPGPSAANMVPR